MKQNEYKRSRRSVEEEREIKITQPNKIYIGI